MATRIKPRHHVVQYLNQSAHILLNEELHGHVVSSFFNILLFFHASLTAESALTPFKPCYQASAEPLHVFSFSLPRHTAKSCLKHPVVTY